MWLVGCPASSEIRLRRTDHLLTHSPSGMPPTIDLQPNQDEIERLYFEGHTHQQLVQWLADRGLIVAPRTLKRRLKDWSLTRWRAAETPTALAASSAPPPTTARPSPYPRCLEYGGLDTTGITGSPDERLPAEALRCWIFLEIHTVVSGQRIVSTAAVAIERVGENYSRLVG